MTVKKQTLVKRGVVKKETDNISTLLSRDNVDKAKLESLVKDVAKYVELPDVPFSKNSRGDNDVAIFDFSQKKQAEEMYKTPDPNTIVTLVGDALKEPFWPLGTGANRALLSAMDTAWLVKKFFSEPNTPPEKLRESTKKYYKVLSVSSPEDLHKNFGIHSIDPHTRYKV
eukprot:TRINITY_DN829_c0_g1_i1.p1 TRINITY_DN829_c0_g1~~TRINITY_DN829_c0_g1_i1.p1  ORF type:complete len:170 (-),score=27.67 TRINITY_DN829_c0_g1_i1:96-605(-)